MARSTLTARPVREYESEEWLRVRQALWPDPPVGDHRQEMRRILRDRAHNEVFVLERPDGSLGGFLESSIHPSAVGCGPGPVGYIEGWYVDADLRRQGRGRELVEAAEAWARARGCTEMASDCLLDNDVSFAAHTAIGYEETERLIHFKRRIAPRPTEG